MVKWCRQWWVRSWSEVCPTRKLKRYWNRWVQGHASNRCWFQIDSSSIEEEWHSKGWSKTSNKAKASWIRWKNRWICVPDSQVVSNGVLGWPFDVWKVYLLHEHNLLCHPCHKLECKIEETLYSKKISCLFDDPIFLFVIKEGADSNLFQFQFPVFDVVWSRYWTIETAFVPKKRKEMRMRLLSMLFYHANTLNPVLRIE